MNQRDMAVIQGMLDARAARTVESNQSVVTPYDIDTESELWDAWWEGYNFEREPKIIE